MIEPRRETCAEAYERGEASLGSTLLVADLETPVSAYLKLTAAGAART